MIATHPQGTPGRPDEVRWVTPPGLLDAVASDAVASDAVPSAVRPLLDDGTLVAVRFEPDAVVTVLAPGRTWRDEGARVRTAVHATLDERLDQRTPAGQAAARDAMVQACLSGSCHACPAATITARLELEAEARRRQPGRRPALIASVTRAVLIQPSSRRSKDP